MTDNLIHYILIKLIDPSTATDLNLKKKKGKRKYYLLAMIIYNKLNMDEDTTRSELNLAQTV